MSSQLPLGKKTYQLYRDKTAPHIGSLLRNYLKLKGIPATHLAAKIDRNHTTIASYYKNPSIQLHILCEISKALEYNFFADIAAKLPEHFKKTATPESIELENLRKENELLKELLKR